MLKTLLILIFFYYVGKALKAFLMPEWQSRPRPEARFDDAKTQANTDAFHARERVVLGEMVACAACGIYSVKSQAIEAKGKYYCSSACRQM